MLLEAVMALLSSSGAQVPRFEQESAPAPDEVSVSGGPIENTVTSRLGALLDEHCSDCHYAADLERPVLKSGASLSTELLVASAVQIASGQMPPKGEEISMSARTDLILELCRILGDVPRCSQALRPRSRPPPAIRPEIFLSNAELLAPKGAERVTAPARHLMKAAARTKGAHVLGPGTVLAESLIAVERCAATTTGSTADHRLRLSECVRSTMDWKTIVVPK